MYFMAYESVKQLLATARGNSPTSPLAVMTAGGLCGLVSWAAVWFPFVPSAKILISDRRFTLSTL